MQAASRYAAAAAARVGALDAALDVPGGFVTLREGGALYEAGKVRSTN